MKTGVFIVDDHYMVIEGIRSLLQNEKDIEWLGHAMNVASCHAFLKQQLPDIILMDVNLPDLSGIELCKEVRQLFPSVFVLGLSTFNQRPVIQNMIDNGASGYILKNATKEELLDAIGTVMKGKSFLSFDAALSMKDPIDKAPLITRREKEILQLIAEGLTNAEIGEKLFISIPTVNTHRKSLLEKFGAKNTAALISKASKSGIL
ncbi:two component transcriptional regulator, LuxR family [Chitinophaga terrae (ex Kim and Jung 2007)]|uniref:Two component transcriptional regulator, LuxR family n=1 Tax=Chitinophaga terrae (ex Kim and Jung 2007) TaxID=408074 RepID=A0A1H4BLJ3_9BACT|nr:response regulator transcription factor [Chitinophaga terrae (ex Kim and Jung 2007)]GEP89637.1 DNA-binding response regulator [Chitinophaga terrae (ex Kim and Jung 2007)]SEA48977.1 two component transcriptional regulator, LuxR family [Chitinophaga terrae (ex Kim and Jung 2007)]